jgi:glutaconate CoA-transferase subunit A
MRSRHKRPDSDFAARRHLDLPRAEHMMRPDACPLKGSLLSHSPVQDLDALSAAIPDGAKLVVPADYSGVAMAATRALIRRGVRGLHLVCLPTSGLQADMLIGAGAVATIETSAVTLGEFGPAPRFVEAVRRGVVALRDATCPAIHAGIQAAEKGLPFMPLRGIIGSDLIANRPDWKVIDNPFAENDRILVLPAIEPDVALFHAPLADREGNVWIGRRRELMTMAHAAKRTFVTVEAISETSLFGDEKRAAGVIPALYVTGVAEAKRGAAPLGLWGAYEADETFLSDYVSKAKTKAGFNAFLADWLRRPPLAAA